MGAGHFHYTHMIFKVICICKWRNWSIARISALHYRPMAECVRLGGSPPYRNGGSLAPFHSSMIIMTLAGPGLENIGLRGKENEGRFPFRSWHLICRENLPRIPLLLLLLLLFFLPPAPPTWSDSLTGVCPFELKRIMIHRLSSQKWIKGQGKGGGCSPEQVLIQKGASARHTEPEHLD